MGSKQLLVSADGWRCQIRGVKGRECGRPRHEHELNLADADIGWVGSKQLLVSADGWRCQIRGVKGRECGRQKLAAESLLLIYAILSMQNLLLTLAFL